MPFYTQLSTVIFKQMTTAERDTYWANPVDNLVIHNVTTDTIQVYDDLSETWKDIVFTADLHDAVTVGTGLDLTGQLVELDLSEVPAGGELAGTMDAPTVDANHGGTHAIGQGGTGQTTAQAAIDALSQVAGATNEHVLTKDTATGNAIFKAASGGGSGHTIQDDDTPKTARTNLSFQDGFVLTDDAGGDQTEIDLDYATTEIADISSAEAAGSSIKVPRADHVHAHEAAHIAHDTIWAALGDILAATANDTAAVVSGNTTVKRKYLSQTGNGSVSATPAWNVLQRQLKIQATSLAVDAAHPPLGFTAYEAADAATFRLTINYQTAPTASTDQVWEIWKAAIGGTFSQAVAFTCNPAGVSTRRYVSSTDISVVQGDQFYLAHTAGDATGGWVEATLLEQ